MQPMTHRERVYNTLHRKPVDQIPVLLSPWGETVTRWTGEKHLTENESLVTHFDQSARCGGWIDPMADLDFKPVVLEETEDTILTLDGNGARLRRYKKHETTPEHVGYAVRTRADWEERIKPHLLKTDPRRYDLKNYREQRALAAAEQRFFFLTAIAPFECMHLVIGHEGLLLNICEDPDWISDMAETYADFLIAQLQAIVDAGGRPDGFYFFEDLGFKMKPFLSLPMYRIFFLQAHRRMFDFAHAQGCPVMLHSCGFVEPLVPGFIEAGINCLQAMEVKAGMDMPRLCERFGQSIAFCGNMDVRALVDNDRPRIDRELEKMLPVLKSGSGYILHTDHSEPPQVDHATEWYFVRQGIATGARVLAGR